MEFEPFGLHDWLVAHERDVKLSLAHSGIQSVPARELGVAPASLLDGDLGYGPIPTDPRLPERIASVYHLPADRVMVTNAGSEANLIAFMALVRPGDKVVVERPTYNPLRALPQAMGATIVAHDRTWTNKFRIDLGQLEEQAKGATLLVLTNLNNPTGVGVTRRELEEVGAIAERRGCWVLVDEAFRELAWELPPIAATLGDRFISTTTMTKCWGLAGLRTGWLVGTPAFLQKASVVKSYVSLSNALLEQRLALAALDQQGKLLARARRIRDANFASVKAWLERHARLQWVAPDGGPICAPRLPPGLDDEAFGRALVAEHGTLVAPGSRQGLPGHFRLGFGGDAAGLAPGMHNIDAALAARA